MKFLKVLIKGAVLTLLPAIMSAQESKETLRFSLKQAQEYALQNNRSVKSANIDIEIARKKVWETTAIGLPQFSATADYQHLFKVPEASFGGQTTLALNDAVGNSDVITGQMVRNNQLSLGYLPGNPIKLGVADNTTFNFTLSQLVFSGEYIVGLQAARVYKELSEKSLAKTELLTKQSVANGYYLALVLDENIKLLNESYKTIEQSYIEITKMNEQGFLEETDVDQLKISKLNLKTAITSLEGNKEVSLKLLKIQLGIDYDQKLELTDSIAGIINNGTIQYLSSFDFDVNSSVDMELMKTSEGLSLLSLRRQKSTFLPTISAFYRHQELLNEPLLNFQPKDVLGATISLPIFTSGQRLSKVGQAKLDLDKTRLSKDDVEQSLIVEFENARNAYQTAFSNYSSNKESMELSQKVYNKALIKFKEGVSTSFELTQIQNQYITSESTYYNSLLTLLEAQAKLDRILSKYQN